MKGAQSEWKKLTEWKNSAPRRPRAAAGRGGVKRGRARQNPLKREERRSSWPIDQPGRDGELPSPHLTCVTVVDRVRAAEPTKGKRDEYGLACDLYADPCRYRDRGRDRLHDCRADERLERELAVERLRCGRSARRIRLLCRSEPGVWPCRGVIDHALLAVQRIGRLLKYRHGTE